MATKRLRRRRDPIQLGKLIVAIATGQVEDIEKTNKDPTASELGRLGGLKGGKARAAKQTPARRSEIAKSAALARYGRRHGGDGGKT